MFQVGDKVTPNCDEAIIEKGVIATVLELRYRGEHIVLDIPGRDHRFDPWVATASRWSLADSVSSPFDLSVRSYIRQELG